MVETIPLVRILDAYRSRENPVYHYAGTWYSENAKKKAQLKRIIPNVILRNRIKGIAQRDIKKIELELSGEQ